MTTRSTKLATLNADTAGYVTLYTSPTGYRTIIKSLAYANISSAPVFVQVIGQDAISAASVYLFWGNVPAQSIGYWSGWFVLHQHDFVLLNVGATGTHYWLSGTQLPEAPLLSG